MLVGISSPFGSRTRTRILVALHLLQESHPRELARLLRSHLNSVQAALRGLERDGLVATRSAGRTRLVTLDPRYFAGRELARYLTRLAEADDALSTSTAALRRRPRRSGKPL
jgi:DNA-binding MarR family transcriptional regulator